VGGAVGISIKGARAIVAKNAKLVGNSLALKNDATATLEIGQRVLSRDGSVLSPPGSVEGGKVSKPWFNGLGKMNKPVMKKAMDIKGSIYFEAMYNVIESKTNTDPECTTPGIALQKLKVADVTQQAIDDKIVSVPENAAALLSLTVTKLRLLSKHLGQGGHPKIAVDIIKADLLFVMFPLVSAEIDFPDTLEQLQRFTTSKLVHLWRTSDLPDLTNPINKVDLLIGLKPKLYAHIASKSNETELGNRRRNSRRGINAMADQPVHKVSRTSGGSVRGR
jgi:hypothetical protein